MGLFKSSEERRMERDMEIRKGLSRIKKQIRSFEREEQDFIKKAKRARQLGDESMLNVIKANLKRTAYTRRMMERQLLNLEVFKQLKGQAEAQATFARSLETVSEAIAESYGSVNLAQVHKNCEKAVNQAESMQQMMEFMMESTSESMADMEGAQSDDLISDAEIDRMIDEEIVAEETEDMDDKVGGRLESLRERFEKNRDKA
ncbi:MAG TPA: hypothetical protein DEA08_05690 [Planctomycetes bacterium]|nr:hypothetical protein [Planctomycetota bacterium]|tara:strand:- start:135 stop:743 length:609 start_codon:yes stop_codon:yes gene_type:complete